MLALVAVLLGPFSALIHLYGLWSFVFDAVISFSLFEFCSSPDGMAIGFMGYLIHFH